MGLDHALGAGNIAAVLGRHLDRIGMVAVDEHSDDGLRVVAVEPRPRQTNRGNSVAEELETGTGPYMPWEPCFHAHNGSGAPPIYLHARLRQQPARHVPVVRLLDSK